MRAGPTPAWLCLALIALAPARAPAGAGEPAAEPAPPAAASAGFAAVASRIEAERVRRGLEGAALAVWRDGDFLERRFFGAWDADTVVPVASATKWISAAVILTAVDAGELALDAPLSRHLPGLPPRTGRATVRQLLSMTAGVPRRRGLAGGAASLAAFTEAFGRERALVAEPGRDFRYAGDGFQLAGRAAEVATGRPFRALFRERLARPCALERTRYDANGPPESSMPLLYGGVRTTLDDIARFLAMLLAGGRCGDTRVLSADLVREMHRSQTGGLRLRAAGPARLAAQSRYGLGSWIDVPGEDGRAVQSSSPGSFGTTPWIHWERGLAGVLLQVAVDPERGMIPPFEIVKAVHGAVDALE